MVGVEGVADPPQPSDDELIERSVARAASLLVQSQELVHRREGRQADNLAALIADDAGKEFLLELTDRVMRLEAPDLAADVFARIAARPPPVGLLDRVALHAGAILARRVPRLVMPAVRRRIRRETRALVLPTGAGLDRAIAGLRAEGFRLNINVLGEMVLGDDEARRRTDAVIEQLRRPDVDYVSVKISSLCAQLNVLAFDDSVERIVEQLATVLTEAARHRPPKFVNLDMEEYRDLSLTVAAFRRALDDARFLGLDAGIVLQAYLPDSFGALQELTEWASRRHRSHGSHVKVRVVKGANLAMEQVEAELHGWEQAPYASKAEVDANYKRMVDHLLQPRFDGALRVGVASHNLFDVAWAIERAADAGATHRLEIEMLNGMAPGQARAVLHDAGHVLLYAPIVDEDDFPSAISYLARRLDENSSADNFLSHVLTIEPGNAQWRAEAARFRRAVLDRASVASTPRRTQDRATDAPTLGVDDPFTNVADTDFTSASNRSWITAHLGAAGVGDDPWSARRIAGATVDQVDSMVAIARAAAPGWAARSAEERRQILHRVAEVMAAERGATIATMAVEAGKTVVEGDVEVSEAIDFARYYAADAVRLAEIPGGRLEPRGVVLVVPPWNFPYAIPAGGVLAALAAGNTVILKPAPQSERTAWALARQLWEGGVPAEALQYVTVDEGTVGRHLIAHDGVDAVVLTGAYDTAQLFLSWRPELHLLAETSGKNAIVVTPHADLDLAVGDIVRSAFGHAGQKCSAASLVIAVGSVYESTDFRRKLADATRTVVVGEAIDVRSTMGPLIAAPTGPLARALTSLDAGEAWLVAPFGEPDRPAMWHPGIRLGVAEGSWFHLTECFGPVLGVMRARDLDHAIEIQNAVSFGLTGGIESLDPQEVSRWLDRVEVGNAYVNRHITGAIVQRQPFGGWKRSAVGPTAKAGGPDYVAALGRWHDDGDPTPDAVAAGYRAWWTPRQAGGHDATGLHSERNELRYRPLPRPVMVLVDEGTDPVQIERARIAATTVGTDVQIVTIAHADAAGATRGGDVSRVRALVPVGDGLRAAASASNVPIDDAPISCVAAIELPRWLRAQAISETMHRYGNVRRARS
jgi:RHH-type proline utilization regulon transcriptional repressor/proline dehydrogenase/delta 1-pyrroline-5-carboxylate dehydrogenase